jgi:ribosomal protein RSM22 (predicted rRNA methylase)
LHQKNHFAPNIVKTQTYNKLDLPPFRAGLSKEVLFISEMYQRGSTKLYEIWRREELALAYIAYYLPLNWLRALSVIAEGQRLGFFEDLERVIDFGSGPGTFQFAALESHLRFSAWSFIEHEKAAQDWHKRFLASLADAPTEKDCEWSRDAIDIDKAQAKQTMGVFSYSLNEMASLPAWAFDLEALCIIEPSTAEAGRRLQELRQKLIDSGFSIWAPCTHQGHCPLLTHSKTDWCHHRIHVELPDQVMELEKNLPIKNTSLTYSYVLARRMAPTPTQTPQARVIGDTLYERGKVRQAVCRGPEREFLSWLTRFGEPDPIERGTLIDIPDTAEIKGPEIRLPRN